MDELDTCYLPLAYRLATSKYRELPRNSKLPRNSIASGGRTSPNPIPAIAPRPTFLPALHARPAPTTAGTPAISSLGAYLIKFRLDPALLRCVTGDRRLPGIADGIFGAVIVPPYLYLNHI
jgi:hypothetical protein